MTRKRIICIYVLVLKQRIFRDTQRSVAIMTEKINLIHERTPKRKGGDHEQNEEEGKWSILFQTLVFREA
jgi:hypothetical protein